MSSGVNTSLFAGIGAGTSLVAAGIIGASVLFPPAPRDVVQPAADPLVHSEQGTIETEADLLDLATPSSVDTSSEMAEAPEPEPAEPGVGLADPTFAPDVEAVPEADIDSEPQTFSAAPRTSSANPAARDALSDDLPPTAPNPEDGSVQARLPSGLSLIPRNESGQPLPQVLPPPAPKPDATDPLTSDVPDMDGGPDGVAIGVQDSAALPGMRGSSLPQIGGGGDPSPPVAADVLAPEEAAVSALERNSLYAGGSTGPKMALILNDPGLPMPMRRSLAAIDFDFTVALNPLDTSAPDAADIYMNAGKEVLILATSIPEGATASDLDVNFNAFFANLPMAVGVIDLPETGFGRNARLLGEVLPLLREDGHGLVTFSGGLAQAERAAQAAGVAHAEVFRVLDSGNDSAFTIRRFLDRAVFQASQMGEVIVFGDASNDVTMEAIEMWRSGSSLDQVALVPVSGILLEQ